MIETSITECCKANIPSQCRFEQSVWCYEARYMLANYTKLQAITLYKLASKVCYFNWISVESTRMKQIYLERQEKRNYKAKMESIRTCVTKDMVVLKIDTHVCSRLVEGVYLRKASLAIVKLHDLFRNFSMILQSKILRNLRLLTRSELAFYMSTNKRSQNLWQVVSCYAILWESLLSTHINVPRMESTLCNSCQECYQSQKNNAWMQALVMPAAPQILRGNVRIET